jgi:tetratricopeptide (TPR) repeat protein
MDESCGSDMLDPDLLAAEAAVRVRAALAGGDGVAAARELLTHWARRSLLDDPLGSWLAGVLDLSQAVDAAAASPALRSVRTLTWLAALSARAAPDEAVRAADLAADAAGKAGVLSLEDVQALAPLLPLLWAVNLPAVLRLVGRAGGNHWDEALAELTLELVAAGDLAGAVEAADHVGDAVTRERTTARSLVAEARRLGDRAGQPDAARLAEALAAAGSVGVMAAANADRLRGAVAHRIAARLLRLGHRDEAVRVLQRVHSSPSREPTGDSGDPLPLLRELAVLGMDGHAAASIDRSGQDVAARARAWLVLADGALASGRPAGAQAHLASALAVTADLTGATRDEALRRATESLVELGDLAGARRVAEGLAAAPTRAAAIVRIARAALSSGALDAAREDAERAAADIARAEDLPRHEVVRDMDVADVWCGIAEALHARDRHAEAAAAFRAAIAAVRMTGAGSGVWALAGVVERAVAVRGAEVVEEAVVIHDLPHRHHPVLEAAAVGGLARVGRLGEALGLTRTIAAPLARAVALLELVAASGAATWPVHDHPWLHEALGWLDRHEADEVIELLDFASPDLEWRARCAEGLARAGLVDRAFAMAVGMPNGTGDRERALMRVGEALLATDRWADALAAFDAALASAADGNVLRRSQTLARVAQQCATAGHPAEGLVRIRAWADDRERAEVLGTLGANLETPADRGTAFGLLSGVHDAAARASARARLIRGLLARGDVGADELARHLDPQEETVAALEVARAAARAGDAETFARVAPTVRDGLGTALTALQVARLLPAQAAEVAEEVVGSGWALIG